MKKSQKKKNSPKKPERKCTCKKKKKGRIRASSQKLSKRGDSNMERFRYWKGRGRLSFSTLGNSLSKSETSSAPKKERNEDLVKHPQPLKKEKEDLVPDTASSLKPSLKAVLSAERQQFGNSDLCLDEYPGEGTGGKIEVPIIDGPNPSPHKQKNPLDLKEQQCIWRCQFECNCAFEGVGADAIVSEITGNGRDGKDADVGIVHSQVPYVSLLVCKSSYKCTMKTLGWASQSPKEWELKSYKLKLIH